jgi:hypothetical protein
LKLDAKRSFKGPYIIKAAMETVIKKIMCLIISDFEIPTKASRLIIKLQKSTTGGNLGLNHPGRV